MLDDFNHLLNISVSWIKLYLKHMLLDQENCAIIFARDFVKSFNFSISYNLHVVLLFLLPMIYVKFPYEKNFVFN